MRTWKNCWRDDMATPEPEWHDYINDFEESVQESGETPLALLSRLRQLASTAFPNLSQEAQRVRVLSKFVMSLRDQRLKKELQVYVFKKEESSTTRTYEEILSKATRLESWWRAAENRITGQQNANTVRADSTVEALRSQIEDLIDLVAALPSHSTRAPQARRQPGPCNSKCYRFNRT